MQKWKATTTKLYSLFIVCIRCHSVDLRHLFFFALAHKTQRARTRLNFAAVSRAVFLHVGCCAKRTIFFCRGRCHYLTDIFIVSRLRKKDTTRADTENETKMIIFICFTTRVRDRQL